MPLSLPAILYLQANWLAIKYLLPNWLAIRVLEATVLRALLVKMATTAHEDQAKDKTDDHAADGADDDTHRDARLGCQCTGQHERHWLRWR